MSTDRDQILHLMDEWRRATAAGDLDAILALMTDDAVFLTPGNPPMTRDDFAAGFRSFAGKIQIDASQVVRELQITDTLAYCWSHVSVAMTSTETGTKTRRAGHVLTVYRKSPDGKWRLCRDANPMVGP